MRLDIPLALLPLAAAQNWVKRDEPAPLLVPEGIDESDLITSKYIVKFKDDVASVAASVDGALSILSEAPDHVYSSAINGFAGTLDDEALDALLHHPDVDYIEQDVVARTNAFVTQNDAPWGLTRISRRALTPGSTSYTYDNSAGVGTCSYVLDTGVDISHPEFEGRASWLTNLIDNNSSDSTGHGTHVAGTIGSKTYGVAKKTTIYSVKILGAGGSGTLASFIAGIDFVLTDSPTRSCPNGVFINLSVGFSSTVSTANAACDRAVAANVFTAVAAGNDGDDVFWHSPGNANDVCTVGASNATDTRPDWSNYGAKIEVFAPGQGILSTIPGGGTGLKSGTSMATPHVAGLAAYLAGLEGFPGAKQLCARIQALSTKEVLDNLPEEWTPDLESPNFLAFNGNPSG